MRDALRKIAWLREAVRGFRRSRAYGIVRWYRGWRDDRRWDRLGRPIPAPASFKYTVIKAYARQHRLRTVVETGTYHGGLIHATSRLFERIISIELDDTLYRRAVETFASSRYRHVTLLHGDSGALMPRVLETI